MEKSNVLLALLLAPALASAQMTVSGSVTSSAGVPVQGATVSVSTLGINARTSADGRYAFIIRAAQVMGQTVSITARHSRFGSQTVQIQIVGGSLEQNFTLSAAQRPPAPDQPRDTVRVVPPAAVPTAGADARFIREPALLVGSPESDAGPLDLPSAIAGRHAALNVTAASTIDGSAPMLYRGARSLFANAQPLVVVDGVPVDNTGWATVAQRFGLGGFDYGSPLNDIAVDDVEMVSILDPLTATLRYGSRAANGVLEVRTKSGRGITGFLVTATTRFSGQSATGLPAFQNSFGQGLGGQYEFFDGQGRGINDAVAQSWGPRLDATPIPQHSLTEPRRPDVRHWLPQPDDVREYFGGASTADANVALLGTRELASMRLAVNARSAKGLTPGSDSRRLGLVFAGETRTGDRLTATLNAQLAGTTAKQRPGTGFDEVNPVAGFTRMGRQVDLDALGARLTDDNGDQINWIYTNRNNPWFATSLNSNASDRRHLVGGASVRYDLTRLVGVTLSAATDDWTETRKVRVAAGWLGGFPTTVGRGDFSGGGTDEQTVGASERLVTLALDARGGDAFGFGLAGTLGGELRANEYRTTAVVTDQPADGESAITNLEASGKHDVTSFFASARAVRGAFALDGGARVDQSSSLSKSYSAVYPTAQLSYTRLATLPGERNAFGLGETRLFLRWWRAGNEVTRRTLTTAFFGGTPIAPEVDIAGPERTEGVEVGGGVVTPGHRVALYVTGYRERSTELLVASTPGDGSAVLGQTGQIFNGGVQALLGMNIVQNWRGLDGGFRLTAARNGGTVDALLPGVSRTTLSPNLFGAQVAAQVGGKAAVIVGSRYLRDAGGSLILRNGVPIADANQPFSMVGVVRPDWTAAIDTRWSYRGVHLYLLIDSRFGGKVLSATNMWGSYAGTLDNTLIGDRAPGAAADDSLTIAGIDSLTGSANTTRVSAEQYFHAIGAITEPWVYDASFTKLREASISHEIPTRFLPGFREHRLRVSLIGRNLVTWANAPNIDPETALSSGVFQGFEMGQLPSTRSLGVQLTIAP